MKNIYSKKITILIVITAVITISIYLFLPKDAEVPKTTQPIPATQTQNQPIQTSI